ncbi:MAG: hypothetical protein HQ481_09675 [Alphaproteobacteria bacterium]|nr:hypothetical protein [Alphaproteobacteria bacterium]
MARQFDDRLSQPVEVTHACPPDECGASASCHQAVTRAYAALKRAGAEEKVAFEAAEAVYAWHHPEVPRARVPFVIADWLP